jgi:exodeoxyribonuclease X
MLKNAHSALADVGICAVILQHICQARSIVSMEELWLASESARSPSVMPFGKHKGMAMADVPADYKRWLLGQGDIDPYLRKALEAR